MNEAKSLFPAVNNVAVSTLSLDAFTQIIHDYPQPQAETEVAQFSAFAIANHLIFLILTASDANYSGRHSAAVSIFHSMEDAFDCFGAVSLIPGAAEQWANSKLKASQAVILYESMLETVRLATGETAMEYRRRLRAHFNQYSQCTPYLIDWNLYPHFKGEEVRKLFNNEVDIDIRSEIKVNPGDRLLVQNANRIGGYLTAYMLEFAHLVEIGYRDYLNSHHKHEKKLKETAYQLESRARKHLMAESSESLPPEIGNPRIQHPDDPELIINLDLMYSTVGEA